jgi:signal peptidase II
MNPTSPRAGRYRTLGLAVAALILIADQAIKWVVTYVLSLESVRSIEILPFFNLTWVRNYGISFGMMTADGDGQRWLLVALTALVACGVAFWMWREKSRADVVALGFILGGALGNIIDRARVGYVIDYADLHFGEFRPFLIFNVADAAITIGVLLLVARAFLLRDKAPTGQAG